MLRNRPFLRRPSTWLLWLPTALFALWIVSKFIPKPWSSRPISARVVDVSGRPVAGVNVVATWDTVRYWTNFPRGAIHLGEAVTDGNGKFTVAGWEGKYIRNGTMQGDQPTLFLYKRGYLPTVLANPRTHTLSLAKHEVVFMLEGKNIVIQPFSGTPEEFHAALDPLARGLLHSLSGAEPCQWRYIPMVLLAFEDLKHEMATSDHRIWGVDISYIRPRPASTECPNSTQFFDQARRPRHL